MSLHILQNFFKQTITQSWATGTGNFYVSVKPVPTSGWLVISPSSTTLREIIYYSGVGSDSTGDYITISTGGRGLGGTTEQTHDIGEPVRMNYTAEHQDEISDALDQIVAGGAQDASTTTKGISKMSVAPASATNPIAVGDNDPRVPTADPTTIFAIKKFGGTGADGALAITSGTTTIDLGGVAVVIKNYTSISITGTGVLAFSNPHANGTIVILKSQGNVTITSSANPTIDLRGIGASAATNGLSTFGISSKGGGSGSVASTGNGGGVGYAKLTEDLILAKNVTICVGAGGGDGARGNNWGSNQGGGGGAGGASLINGGANGGGYDGNGTVDNGSAGAGGRGGGSLLIECAGAYNASAVFNSSGANGANATGTGANGGGGGGAGGTILVIYNTLTSNTATYTVAGGAGGNRTGGGGVGGAGGAGDSLVIANTDFA